MKKVRVATSIASWGDMMEPAVELAENGELDYLGLDHLAELSLAILQRWKAKDPTKGYVPDIIPYMKLVLPAARRSGTKIITNSGGANPEAAADAVVGVAKALGFSGLKIGVVLGDDLLPRIDELRAQGVKFPNLDTGEEDLDRIKDKIVAANAYIGADSIIDSLADDADIVIAGRISDNAVYVGPFMHEFGWKFEDGYWDRIGAAITVGHLLECGPYAAGGASNYWKALPEPWHPSYPIAELHENGEALITKLQGTGGMVTLGTIKDQLVYEVHDPRNYLMPDGVADFTTLHLEDVGPDRVRITGMTGKKRPDALKVCIGFDDGFIGEGHIWFPAPEAFEKAQWAEKWIRERLKLINAQYDELRIDYLGVNSLFGKSVEMPPSYVREMNEVGIRLVVKTQSHAEADRIKRLATHLWTHGPIGSSFGVPIAVRPIVALWPSLVPREVVPSKSIMKVVR